MLLVVELEEHDVEEDVDVEDEVEYEQLVLLDDVVELLDVAGGVKSPENRGFMCEYSPLIMVVSSAFAHTIVIAVLPSR